MQPPGKGIEPMRKRRVRKRRRATDDDPKAHYGIIFPGQNTQRILNQIANGEKSDWEGEYRE